MQRTQLAEVQDHLKSGLQSPETLGFNWPGPRPSVPSIASVANALFDSTDLGVVREVAIAELKNVSGANIVVLDWRDTELRDRSASAADHLESGALDYLRHALAPEIAEVLRRGEPRFISDAAELLADIGIMSVALVPLAARGATLGVAVMAFMRRTRFSVVQEHQLTECGRMIAHAHCHTILTSRDRVAVQAVNFLKEEREEAQLVEEELAAALRELRTSRMQLLQSQKMQAVGHLTGGVAHDFANIITVMRSYAEFLKSSLADGDERRVDVNEIQIATDRAAALTRQLLAFSRTRTTPDTIVDVNAVVRGIEPMLRRLIGEDIELAVMLSECELDICADHGQLEQVITNLVVNARDSMQNGGVLSIETDVRFAHGGEHFDELVTLPRGRYCAIRVTDTGGGISPRILPDLFEPFFTTKDAAHGTGLGLATVREIVLQARGYVRVAHTSTSGTSFEVLIPTLEESEEGGQHLASHAHRSRASGTILVVEDEIAVRTSIRKMLERVGYVVLEARHGEDALMLWNERGRSIDLVLTDLRMPAMGGRELIAALREKKPSLPAVMMSGYRPDSVEGLADGVTFLQKPFTGDSLYSVIEAGIRTGPAAEG